MKYAWLVLGVFAARFLSTAIAFPPGDGDLFWQRRLGASVLANHAVPRALGNEAFAAPGAPWVPQEWLFGIAAYLGRSGWGWDVFSGACALAALAALTIACLHAVRRGASPVDVAICVALAGIALFESFGVRAQVAVWPLLALFLLLLDIDGPWCYAAAAVAAVWSNLHASAMLAPILAGMVAFGSALDERRIGKRTRRLAIVAVLCAVAICCNPFGWDLPRYAIGLFNNPIKSYITEWKVTDIDDLSFVGGALPLLLLAMILGTRGTPEAPNDRRWRDFLLLGVFGFLVLSAARNVNIFGIAALPIVASALARRNFFGLVAQRPPTRIDRIAAVAFPVGTFAVAIAIAARLISTTPPATGLANAPLAALSKMPGDHRVFCADFAWCSLLLGVPHESVFLDGRADPFPRDVWEDFARVIRLEPSWRDILARRGVDTVVAKRYSPLDQALELARGWRPAYTDKDYRLWLRSTATRT